MGRCFLGLNKGEVETLFLFTQRMNEAEFLKGTDMWMCVRAKKILSLRKILRYVQQN